MLLHKAIISIGSNRENGEQILRNACNILALWVNGLNGTRYLRNPALGMSEGSPDFMNRLIAVYTTLSLHELKALLKHLELMLGDIKELRKDGIVTLDCDLDIYDGVILKSQNVEREYFHILFAELAD